MSTELDDVREFWNRVADDWRIQVGSGGDVNRRLNSDPVLWKFAGDVRGLRVLDAGCGTGYLSIQLAKCGALVTGIDFAERMIAIARRADPSADFRVDSCSELATAGNAEFHLVVANYMLMDSPDLQETMKAFVETGFAVLDFEEPRVTQDRYHLVETEAALRNSLACPYSVAFKLQKATAPA